jgi:phosphoribosyl-ATP pyrophosphohydrolase
MTTATEYSKFAKQDAKDAKALIAELLATTDLKEAKTIGEELTAAVIAMAQNKRAELDRLAMTEVCNTWKPPTE